MLLRERDVGHRRDTAFRHPSSNRFRGLYQSIDVVGAGPGAMQYIYFSGTLGPAVIEHSATKLGWTVGAGIDMSLGGQWVVRSIAFPISGIPLSAASVRSALRTHGLAAVVLLPRAIR
jgi:hypothetical protein